MINTCPLLGSYAMCYDAVSKMFGGTDKLVLTMCYDHMRFPNLPEMPSFMLTCDQSQTSWMKV